MVLITAFTSVAQVFYKKGANVLTFTFEGIFTNYFLFIGLVIYAIASILMILAFRGGEVSALYPIIATSYIWVSILSFYVFNETINTFKWLGVSTIFIGIVFISVGSKKLDSLQFTEAV